MLKLSHLLQLEQSILPSTSQDIEKNPCMNRISCHSIFLIFTLIVTLIYESFYMFYFDIDSSLVILSVALTLCFWKLLLVVLFYNSQHYEMLCLFYCVSSTNFMLNHVQCTPDILTYGVPEKKHI